jgi:YVTN family beta-propeller protein
MEYRHAIWRVLVLRLPSGLLVAGLLLSRVGAAIAETAPPDVSPPSDGGVQRPTIASDGPLVQGPGFSFRAPSGDGWVALSPQSVQRLDPAYRIGYAHTIGPNDRALVAVGSMILPASAEPPEAVLGAVARSRRQTANGSAEGRIQVTSSAAAMTTRSGASCWREDEAAQDRGVPGREGEPFSLVHHRLLCLHPDFAGLLIIADASLRLGPGAAASPVEEAEEAVLGSLAFPSFGRRVTAIPLGKNVQGIAATPGAVWVAVGRDEGGVARIDPATNRVLVILPTGRWPIGIAADATGVWVANTGDDTVSRIDPMTDRVAASIRVGHRPLQIAVGAGAVWVTNSGDGTVARIDAATDAVSTVAGVAAEPAGIAVIGETVYVTDYAGDSITRIDGATAAVTGKMPAGRRSGTILAAGDELWANDPDEHAVLQLYPRDASRAPKTIDTGIGVEPAGLARTGDELWVANAAEGLLTVLDVRDLGQAPRSIPIGRHPFALLAIDGSIWATDVEGGTVLRLDAR